MPGMVKLEYVGLAILSCAVVALDAIKPLTIDDPAYYQYAAHIAQKPTDPYGFLLDGNEPALHTLAPPVLLYWLAGAIRFCGDAPWLMKLSLLPFSMLLTFSLHVLYRRWCPGLEG